MTERAGPNCWRGSPCRGLIGHRRDGKKAVLVIVSLFGKTLCGDEYRHRLDNPQAAFLVPGLPRRRGKKFIVSTLFGETHPGFGGSNGGYYL